MTTIYYVFQNAVVLLLIWMNSKQGKIFTLNMHVKINASLYSLMFVDYVRIVIVNGESWYGLWRTMMPGVKYHSYEKRCLWQRKRERQYKVSRIMKVANGEREKGAQNLRVYFKVREMISMWKNVLLAHLCSCFPFLRSIEIYHTLESTMIFTNPSITSLLILLTQSLYFSHYLFQFFLTSLAVFFSPHFLAIFTRTSFSISSASFYLPHHFDFITHIGEENDSTNESEYYFSSEKLIFAWNMIQKN